MVRLQRKNSLRMPELHCSGHPKQQVNTEQDPQKDQTSHPPNPDAYFTRLPAPAKTVSSPKDTPFPGRATASDHLLLYKGVAGITPTARHSHPPTHWHTETCHLSWRGLSKFLMPVLEGAAKAALYSAHRTSTFLMRALRARRAPGRSSPSFLCRALREHEDRPSYPAVMFSTLLRCLEPASRSEGTPHRPGLG